MDLNEKDAVGIKKSRLFLCVGIWWIVMAIVYLMISFKVEEIKKDITKTGVALLQEISDKISLPLLERDVNSLSKILQQVGKKPGVLFSSIVDHKNKIIAYTDISQLIPVKTENINRSDHISFWEASATDHNRIINFSTDVSYAGTKIGEIFLAFSANRINRIQHIFVLAASSSFIILVIVLAGLYFKSFKSIRDQLKTRYRPKVSYPTGFSEGCDIICPLCGEKQPFPREGFTAFNLDSFLITQSVQDKLDPGKFHPSRGIRLSEISNREDLTWLKRQVIFRCTEIIKKLAV